VRSAKSVVAFVAALALAASCAKAPAKSDDSGSASTARPETTAAVTAGGAGNAIATQPAKPSTTRPTAMQRDTNRRRANPRGVDNPCGGVHVNVIVRVDALGGVTDMMSIEIALRNVAKELLAPLASSVVAGSEQFSPAIRAFRVTTRDRAAAGVVVTRLRSAPEVQSAEIDECRMKTQ
jgi:hypothetical protein